MKAKFIRLLALTALVGFTATAVAEEGAETNETPAAEETQTFTQGRAAVLLANRLGFFVSQDQPLNESQAIQLLMQNGIAPQDGWMPNAALTTDDLAVVLVQALGLEENLTEEEQADPSAYRDELVSEFGADILGTSNATVGTYEPDTIVDQADFDNALEIVGDGNNGGENVTPSAP